MCGLLVLRVGAHVPLQLHEVEPIRLDEDQAARAAAGSVELFDEAHSAYLLTACPPLVCPAICAG